MTIGLSSSEYRLGVEEVDGEGQGEKVEVEREKRVKEGAPWMVWRWL